MIEVIKNLQVSACKSFEISVEMNGIQCIDKIVVSAAFHSVRASDRMTISQADLHTDKSGTEYLFPDTCVELFFFTFGIRSV